MKDWITYSLLNSPWLWFGILIVGTLLCFYRRLMEGPVMRFRLYLVELRKLVANVFTPFAVIAAELRRANDLKVLEMEQRLNPKTGESSPVYIITETPRADDTSVFWGDGAEQKGILGIRERLARHWDNVPDADEDD
jgi:hypothetical protein